MNKFLKRTLSGIALVFLIYLALKNGGNLLAGFTFLISLVAFWEYSEAFKLKDIYIIKSLGYLFSLLMFLTNLKLLDLSLGFLLFISLILSLFKLVIDKKTVLFEVGLTMLGILYIPFLFQHIFLLDGYEYIWLVFLTAWGSDTFAYLAGNLFGKRKLYPELSPNKTIEGSLGGILGSGLISALFGLFISSDKIIALFILGAFTSVISQLGDLTASKIKRYTGVKDFGYIIPGHGGILDRFDSVLFTAPTIYYMFKLIIN